MRIVVPVENDPQQTHEHLPRGAKAVIDARAATRLSAVVGDGEFAEFAVAVEEGAATGPTATAAAVMRRTAPGAAIGAATLACLWAGARMNHNFSDMAAHAAADGGSFGVLNAAAGPMFGASRDRGETSGDPAMNLKNSARVAAMAVTAAVTANGALAGDAVQWRVADGGNGHWYRAVRAPGITWNQARDRALVAGGDLVSIGSAQESGWIFQAVVQESTLWWVHPTDGPRHGPWIGLFQDTTAPDYQEPAGGWRWVDGSLPEFIAWASSSIACENQPSDCRCNPAEGCGLNFASYYTAMPCLGECTTSDKWAAAFNDMDVYAISYLIEWSADCNSDGIIDYGQCHDGTLPDYNGNNIPDCCEQGTPCLPGRYPLQWRAEDGGNGHWYQASANLGLTFLNARNQATGVGGDLVTPQSPAELDFVFRNLASDPAMWWYANGIPRHGPWIGLRQDRSRPDYSEPAGGWTWIDGTDATFQNWDLDTCRTQPTDCFCVGGCGLDNAGFYEGDPASGNTVPTWGAFAADMSGRIGGVIIEWSADCNSDGIVDYGQILTGTLPDSNANNIPDCCEPGNNCCVGDIYENHIVDGGDLGILLSEWGVVTPTTNSDLNRDGFVNGADLGMLLANWGPCGG